MVSPTILHLFLSLFTSLSENSKRRDANPLALTSCFHVEVYGTGKSPSSSSCREQLGSGDEVESSATASAHHCSPCVCGLQKSGLVGHSASAIFQWRQGALRRDFETRQSVCAAVADSWGTRRRAASRAADRYAGAVVVRAQTSQRHQCGCSGLSQQTCPGDLGLVGP